LRPIWDIDVFWHVVVGRSILESGSLPTRDLWSAGDPEAPWRSFQWLYQVMVAFLDDRGGLTAVRVASASWVTATFGLAYFVVRRAGFRVAATAALVALLLVAYEDRIRVRPHVVNLTGMLLLVHVVLARPGRPLLLLAMSFVVSFLWSAVHLGGAFIGIVGAVGLLLVTAVLAARTGRAEQDRGILMVAAGAVLGWLVTPGSTEAFLYAAGQHGGSVGAIEEWASYLGALDMLPRIGSHHFALTLLVTPAALALLVLCAALWVRDRQRVERPLGLALAAYLVVLALLWVRFTWMAALSVVLCAAFLRERRALLEARLGPWRNIALVGVAAALLLVNLHYTTLAQFPSVSTAIEARGTDVDPRRFPVQTTRLLALSGIEARVATPGGWGGYVLYHGWPRLRVTVDGRMVASDEVLAITQAVAAIWESGEGIEALPALYARLPADFLLMPHPAFRGGPTGPWVTVAETPLADLYVRGDDPRLPSLRKALAEAWRRATHEVVPP
jgi:hypothetical protein